MKKLFTVILLSASIALCHAQINIPRTQNFQNDISLQGDITITIAADQDNWAPTGFSACTGIRLSCASGDTITGMAAGTDGRIITIYNVGSHPITILSQSDSSTAANRFKFSIGNLRIPVDGSASFIYDETTDRWRLNAATTNYSSYVIHLTQTSTTAPTVAATLANNLGYVTTWARTDVGIYTLTISAYTAGKVFISFGENIVSTTPVNVNFTHAVSGADYVITIKTYQDSTLADALFTTTPFKLEIYK